MDNKFTDEEKQRLKQAGKELPSIMHMILFKLLESSVVAFHKSTHLIYKSHQLSLQPMLRYKIMPHTADLRLQVFGKNHEELFQNAAVGLARLLYRGAEKRINLVHGFEKVSISGESWETVLINFLNEILTLSNINKKVYPKVKILKFLPRARGSPGREAMARGSSMALTAQIFGRSVEKFDEDIKAVSYHQAEILKNEKGFFEVTLTLDI